MTEDSAEGGDTRSPHGSQSDARGLERKRLGTFLPTTASKNADQDASTHTDLQNPKKYKTTFTERSLCVQGAAVLEPEAQTFLSKVSIFLIQTTSPIREKKDNNTGGGRGRVGSGGRLGRGGGLV